MYSSTGPTEATIYYIVMHAEHSGMYVTTNYGLGEGAPAFQWYNADWPESQWYIDHDGTGRFRLRNRWNNLVLDLENNSRDAGTRVVQRPYDGTISQLWTYNSEADSGSQFYRHIRNEHSQLVMDVSGASNDAGAEIIMWPRNGGTNQRFNILARAEDVAADERSTRSEAASL